MTYLPVFVLIFPLIPPVKPVKPVNLVKLVNLVKPVNLVKLVNLVNLVNLAPFKLGYKGQGQTTSLNTDLSFGKERGVRGGSSPVSLIQR